MVDEIIDHFFSSSSWTDVDVKERSSLDCYDYPPTNEMLLGSLGVCVTEDDSNNSAINLSNSNHSMDSMAAQSANSSVAHDSDAQDNGNNCAANFLNDQIGLKCDMDGNVVRSTSVSSLEPQNEGDNSCEQSVFQRLNEDFETLSSVSHLWPLQAYAGVTSSLYPLGMGQQKMCSFGNTDIYEFSDLVTTERVKPEMGVCHLPSYASGPQFPMALTGLQSFPQTTSVEYTGPKKPRVRARRGQATDPHSIAERLRREKIADRMKNLQELVPKSNKTDKASMLDEIIEYVKFLQQQVKILSARRVGSTGAVSLDNQKKGTNGISDSPSLAHDISFNEIAFEQVSKLMETDVSKAMHYLQSKGLCMMSIPLANAILTEKESLASPDSAENLKNSGFTDNGFAHNPSSSSSSNSDSTTLPGTAKRA